MKKLLFFIITIMVLNACSSGEGTKEVNQTDQDKAEGNTTSSGEQPGSETDNGQSLIATESDLTSTESEFEIVINLSSDVLFDFDKYDIKPQADPELMKVYNVISDKGQGTVKINGHTDGKGADDYNMTLSLNRAEAVASWLRNKGLGSSVEFVTQGFGSKQPVAQNSKPSGADDPEGRQKNRRVEIIIQKKRSLSGNIQ